MKNKGCTHRTAWHAWFGVMDTNTVLYNYPKEGLWFKKNCVFLYDTSFTEILWPFSFIHSSALTALSQRLKVAHKPSIYLSIPSHCDLPVEMRYRIWDCRPLVESIFIMIASCFSTLPPHQRNGLEAPTISVTSRFLSNSSRASCLVSFLVTGSEIRLVLRRTWRHKERALLRCRNCCRGAQLALMWILERRNAIRMARECVRAPGLTKNYIHDPGLHQVQT